MTAAFVDETILLLERTPAALDGLLRGLPDAWIRATDGEGTWSAYDVLGHLCHGEQTDWLARMKIILEHGPARPFDPFDREAQFKSADRTMDERLDDFHRLRARNLVELRELGLTDAQLMLEGMHPVLGRVTLRQLLATWAAHDMAHVLQISRTLARRYQPEVGPWAQFLSVMK